MEFSIRFLENQVAQPPDFSKNVEIGKMSTFSLCDDDEEGNCQITFKKWIDDDDSLEFKIEEIKLDQESKDKRHEIISEFSKCTDLNAEEVGYTELIDQIPVDDCFSIFQNCSRKCYIVLVTIHK